ncbi:MAG: hypothetical protein KDJ14_11695 [Xanthomonadales bacterium]|nr:hypothetical protein [Xanthomonadales bacterium]
MKISPLRQFVLAAALWLPACFFLWAVFSSVIVWPIGKASDLILPAMLPGTIEGVLQDRFILQIDTLLQTTQSADGRIGLLSFTVNPLVYAWCMALFCGLVMASPVSVRGRLLQLALGLPVLICVAVWGTVFDCLELLALKSGPLGLAAVEQAGWHVEAIALGSQFGYLILPAVTPIALWVIMNKEFLEELVGWRGELDDAGAGPTATDAGSAGAPSDTTSES